ncbi:pyrimidodiazepine synthase [Calliopsis andreniformis]|uniref:pyrimidodiazepine synthase n=1 Tax=Calliopsis andreniformis TaxID=337506 RepID=UPI003FCC76C5
MSSLHLGAGSEKPEEVKGQARLYSMKYCPFAQRIRLILSYKKIPHDIVNINLQNKPEWYFKIHPEGKVPAFVDADGKVVTDSIVIADYLDEKYPEPPLYNEATKARDLELLDHFSKIASVFSNCIHGKDKRPLTEIIAELSGLAMKFEEELQTRKTDFFGGTQPGMLDILIWPWVERRKTLFMINKESVDVIDGDFSYLKQWIAKMRAQPFVQENECSLPKFVQLLENLQAGKVDYDTL